MITTKISDLADPRLDPYRELKRKNAARRSGRFVVEGAWLVERLLESAFAVESVVTMAGSQLPRDLSIDDSVPVFELEKSDAEKLVGFPFHRGCLGCGIRRRIPHVPDSIAGMSPAVLVALPQTEFDFNLGSVIRSTSAFGGDGILVGSRTADPFSRRALRGSMGQVLFLPVVEPESFEKEVERLRREAGFKLVVLSSRSRATPLPDFDCPSRTILWLGNEEKGVGQRIEASADAIVSIPMISRVDSLNASAAAAVALYHFATQLGKTARSVGG